MGDSRARIAQNCSHTFALQKHYMIGRHLDRELGSERAAVNSIWRQQLDSRTTFKRSTLRNFKKVQVGSPHDRPAATYNIAASVKE